MQVILSLKVTIVAVTLKHPDFDPLESLIQNLLQLVDINLSSRYVCSFLSLERLSL
jgi:hypothetical protein